MAVRTRSSRCTRRCLRTCPDRYWRRSTRVISQRCRPCRRVRARLQLPACPPLRPHALPPLPAMRPPAPACAPPPAARHRQPRGSPPDAAASVAGQPEPALRRVSAPRRGRAARCRRRGCRRCCRCHPRSCPRFRQTSSLNDEQPRHTDTPAKAETKATLDRVSARKTHALSVPRARLGQATAPQRNAHAMRGGPDRDTVILGVRCPTSRSRGR